MITDKLGFYPDRDYPYAALMAQYAEYIITNKHAHDTLLTAMSVQNGKAILSLEGGVCALLANAFADQFKDSGATNYLVLDLFHDDTGPMTITMQRKAGSTPAEKLQVLSDENAALKDQIATLKKT